jgi:hypothetical protein
MFDNHRVPAVVIAIGLSVGMLLVGSLASGGEGVKTRIIVERQACFLGCLEPLPVYLNGKHVGDVSSGGTLDVERVLSADDVNVLKVETTRLFHVFSESHFIPDSPTVRFRMWIEVGWWKNSFKLEAVSGTVAEGAGSMPRITMAERTILKKVGSEEYTAVEGFAVQASWSSTWERGVSLSQMSESLREGGIDVGVLRTKIGKRVADLLAADIRQATTTGSNATIDGNVWERLRIDWYSIVRPGKAFLQADGVTREVAFEYIIGYKPVPVGGKRRDGKYVGANGDGDPSESMLPHDGTRSLDAERSKTLNPFKPSGYR